MKPAGLGASILTLLALALAGPTSGETGDEDVPEAAGAAQLTLAELRTFTDVFEQLRSNYVEELDDRTLLHAAIRGMVSELDRHSSYLDPEEFMALDDSARGEGGNIGAGVVIRNRRLYVQTVQEGGPAALAGIRPGDQVLAVDGQAVEGRRLPESIDALAGVVGSSVELELGTEGGVVRQVVIERAALPTTSVRGEWLQDRIVSFSIDHFHAETDIEFRHLAERLLGEAPDPPTGVVIDLRGNLGGTLQPAAAIADGFLDRGLIVRTQGRRQGSPLEFHAHEGQWVGEVPVALLVDGHTASSAEVLAAALQDHGRARVFGQRTYGKGTIQSILRLRNGGALKLTTAVYLTPSGRMLTDGGIEPDEEVGEEEDPMKAATAWLGSEGFTAR